MASFDAAPEAGPDARRKALSALIREVLDSNEASGLGEVTLLFADIRGFSNVSERISADRLVRLLNHYFARMNEIILGYDGLIDKYIGDAILVVFGVPESKEDDTARAIACAIEMQLAMEGVNRLNLADGLPEIFMGIGIHTGVVSFGKVGSDLYAEYTVIGDGVNMTTRLESHSLRGQILLSETAYEQVAGLVEVGPPNQMRAKGAASPMRFHEVMGLLNDEALRVPRREVRSQVRVECDASFSFCVIEGKEVLERDYYGELKDLSCDGLFAILDFPVEPFTDIQLKIALSLFGGVHRDIYGKVMNVRPIGGRFGCGIMFTSMDDDSRAALRSFVNRLVEGR